MSKIYKSGECLYGLYEKCVLGDKGVPYDPICCLACVIAKYVGVISNVKQ